MSKTKKDSQDSRSEKAVVTRVKAVSAKPSAKTKKTSEKTTASVDKKPGILSRIAGYFKGSWYELKQVRWPTRKSTWGLTLAVILFTGVFVAIIVSLDYGFQQLFDLIIR